MNLVELVDDDQKPSPCAHGNIVVGHACYCHHPDGPRKCPVWSHFGGQPDKWHANGDFDQMNWDGGCLMFSQPNAKQEG